MQKESDIIIVGGGVVGLALACALAQQTSLSITIIEAHAEKQAWQSKQYDYRVSALSLSTCRILKNLNVWEAISSARAEPFVAIEIFEADGKPYLRFDSQEINEAALGFIVENSLLQTALIEVLQRFPSVSLVHETLERYQLHEHAIELTSTNENIYKAKLAIAADGARSWLRQAAGIECQRKDYQQQAIVANVQVELPHQNVARQLFLASGPLAFLPLAQQDQCSIVWSMSHSSAQAMLTLDEHTFLNELQENFNVLGKISAASKRYTFPLLQQNANNYFAERVALVGDAAHLVHPMAGLGANLGMLDMAALVDVIVDATKSHQDFSSRKILRQYERWRKADNLAIITGIDLLKSFFESEHKLVSQARRISLSLASNSSILKKFIIEQAVGNRRGLPRLAS